MVSSLRYSHFANRVLRSKRDLTGIAKLVIPLIAAFYWLQFSLAIGFTFYALSGPVTTLWGRFRERSSPAAPPAA